MHCVLQFMSPYKVPLPIESGFVSPFAKGGERAFRIEAVNNTVDVLAGTRSLTLEITHPGLIWTGESSWDFISFTHTDSHNPSDCV
jgi:hypothetical protein